MHLLDRSTLTRNAVKYCAGEMLSSKQADTIQ